jgi:hypothetical protein
MADPHVPPNEQNTIFVAEGNVPVEMIFLVLDFLEISDICRLRRLSKYLHGAILTYAKNSTWMALKYALDANRITENYIGEITDEESVIRLSRVKQIFPFQIIYKPDGHLSPPILIYGIHSKPPWVKLIAPWSYQLYPQSLKLLEIFNDERRVRVYVTKHATENLFDSQEFMDSIGLLEERIRQSQKTTAIASISYAYHPYDYNSGKDSDINPRRKPREKENRYCLRFKVKISSTDQLYCFYVYLESDYIFTLEAILGDVGQRESSVPGWNEKLPMRWRIPQIISPSQ